VVLSVRYLYNELYCLSYLYHIERVLIGTDSCVIMCLLSGCCRCC